MSKKVYCKDCKYVSPLWNVVVKEASNNLLCNHENSIVRYDTPLSIELYFRTIGERNATNTCQDFERKDEVRV